MTNLEKLDALKRWLDENGYEYKTDHVSKTCGVTMDLKVVHPRVAVKIGEGDDEFFQKVKHYYSPFFIRDDESVEFIIMKMSNCIKLTLKKIEKKEKEKTVRKAEKKAAKIIEPERPKRKRVRIQHFEKVEPRRRRDEERETDN